MKKFGFWSALKTVHDTARRADKRGYYLFLFLSVLCTFRVFAELASTEWVINSVYSLALGERGWKYVARIIVGFGLLKGIFMLLDLLKGRVELGFVYSLNYYTRDTLNSKLAGVKMEYFESHESMVRIHDVKSRMEEIFPKYVRSIAAYITALPLLLIYSAYLSRVNPWYVLTYLVLFVVFNGFLTRKFSGIWSCWDAVQKYDQKQKYYFSLCGDKISHQEYRANRLFGYFTKLWEGAFQDCYRERMKIFRKFEVNLQMSRILLNIPYIVMLALLAFEVLDGKLQVGFLIMANSLLNCILDSYNGIQWNLMENRADARTVSNYRKILDYGEYEPSSFLYRKGEIEIELPEYCYPQSQDRALKPLSLVLRVRRF